MTALDEVLIALRKIDNQADLSVIADHWKRQQTFIGRNSTRGLKKGDTVEWEYRGMERIGVIQKMNRKTVEVADAGNSPFGRTITKIQNSMITRKVAA